MYRNGEKYRSLVNHGGGHWGEVMLDPDAKLFRIYYDSGDYVDLEYNPVGDPKTLKEQAPGVLPIVGTTLSAIQAKIEQIKADQDRIADAIEKYERLRLILDSAIESASLKEGSIQTLSHLRRVIKEELSDDEIAAIQGEIDKRVGKKVERLEDIIRSLAEYLDVPVQF